MCPTFQKMIPLYVRGELAQTDARRLELHMAVCPACRVDAKFENAVSTEALDDLAFADVRAKLALEMAAIPARRGSLVTLLFPKNWWVFAAGSAAVVVALIYLT